MRRALCIRSTVTALVLSLALALPSDAREAAKGGEQPDAAPTQAAPEPQARWTAGQGSDCTRTRRKLWQPGEGWLVKTVTICR